MDKGCAHRPPALIDALAHGLRSARGDLVAVFDADFEPGEDFLERTTSLMAPDVAAVQARWGHINRDQSGLTRAQALALDGYFIVDQTARSRAGMFLVFNGSGGIWRRAAIDQAGGWQGDTLAEDTDLSFRAQLAGWRVVFLPDIAIPAELPPTLDAFRRQQRRWATGTTQLLLKLGRPLLASPHRPLVRAHALLTLGGHLMQPLTLAARKLCWAVVGPLCQPDRRQSLQRQLGLSEIKLGIRSLRQTSDRPFSLPHVQFLIQVPSD